jgi:hypothetical protein
MELVLMKKKQKIILSTLPVFLMSVCLVVPQDHCFIGPFSDTQTGVEREELEMEGLEREKLERRFEG